MNGKIETLLNNASKHFVIGLEVTTSLTCFFCGYTEEHDKATFPEDWHLTKDPDSHSNVLTCTDCISQEHNFLGVEDG